MTKSYTITFAGDTSLGDYYLSKPNRVRELRRLKRNSGSFFKHLKPLVKTSDYFILNLETVLSDNPQTPLEGKEYPNYDNPRRTLKNLKKLGVSAVSLANNHTMDFGPKVLSETINRLSKANIKTFGAGENRKQAGAPLKIEVKGKKSNVNVYVLTGMRASRRYRVDYGFLATEDTPGVNSANESRINQEIKDIREKDPSAIIIICPHWQGIDYKWVGNKIEERCRNYLAAGADFVFGHGTHMSNHIEKNEDGLIAYSIGNFVFNSPGRYKKLGAPPYSLVVDLELKEDEDDWVAEARFYPIVTDNRRTNFNTRPANQEESKELLDILNSRGEDNTTNILDLDKDGKGYYLKAIKNTKITENSDSANSVKKLITSDGEIPKIDFKDEAVFNQHVEQLAQLHQNLDERFFAYYQQIARNRSVTSNKERMKKLNKIVKKEYLSHSFVKRFERNRLPLPTTMSFREIMAERSHMRRLGHTDYSWKLDKKNLAYPFMDSIGVRRPKTDDKVYKFSELKKPESPVVIKPLRATGSIGVYLYFDEENIFAARDGVYLKSWEELQEDANKILDTWRSGKPIGFTKDEWMVEELILDEKDSTLPPSDLKFYAFYGEVVIVLETTRLHKGFCFWDADMNMIETGKHGKGLYEGKGFTKEDLEIVKEASLQIPTPYMRLDMLNGHDGLVFGEATPRPGQYERFNKEYDQILGEAYRRAEARLQKDLLNGKKFETFTDHFKI